MTTATGVNRDVTVDWPTLALILAVYGLLFFATSVLAAGFLPAAIVVTGLLIAQYSSLQHEVLHGHPTPWRWLNEAMVYPGVTLYVPYQRFRDTHLAHHQDERLTDPYDDPETNYLDPMVWQRLAPWHQRLCRLNNRLAGRMLVGPLIGTVDMVGNDLRLARAGDRGVTRAWCHHLAGVVLVGGWLYLWGAMPLWAYALSAYLGLSLLKVRTFLEHRAHDRASGRTVVVEDRGPLALLYLNNNLHVVHHMHPGVAWYRLPAMYRANRDHYLRRNDHYIFRSYAEVFRLYFFTAKDPVPHPLWPGAKAPAPADAVRLKT